MAVGRLLLWQEPAHLPPSCFGEPSAEKVLSPQIHPDNDGTMVTGYKKYLFALALMSALTVNSPISEAGERASGGTNPALAKQTNQSPSMQNLQLKRNQQIQTRRFKMMEKIMEKEHSRASSAINKLR